MPQTDLLEKYRKFAGRMKKAVAETAGWRPARGNYLVTLESINLSDRDFRYTKPAKGKFNGLGIQFGFKMADESSPDVGQAWRGKLWVLPNADDAEFTEVFGPEPPNDPEYKVKTDGEGQWKRIQIQEGRVKGLFAALTGRKEIEDIHAEIALLMQDVADRKESGNPLALEVQVLEDTRSDDPVFDRERILRIVPS